MWPRTLFRSLHQLLGLSLGLLLVSQGLSGAVLVWRPAIERLTLPKSPAGPNGRGSLDAEQAIVRQVIPGGTVRMIRFAQTPDGSDAWNLTPQTANSPSTSHKAAAQWIVYVSPATEKILGVRVRHLDPLDFLIELHHSLFLGSLGRAVLGYLAIATILLALTGLWLWWPASWTPSRFRPRAAAKPLHFAVGFWAMVPLLIIATTALDFVWRQPIQRAFGISAWGKTTVQPFAGEPGRNRSHRRNGPGRAFALPAATPSLDAVVAAATAAVPAEHLTALRFPDRPGDTFTVLFEPGHQHYRAAPDSVTVRIRSDGHAQVAGILLWNQMPRARRLLEWLPRIHQAEFGGPPVRILWSVTGCMPALLYVTGFLMWRRRVRAAKTSLLPTSAR